MAGNPSRSDSLVWILVAVVVLAMLIPGLFFMGVWGGGGMMGGGTSVWGWGIPVMIIAIVVVLILVAVLARGGEQTAAPYPYPPYPPAGGTPLEILDARYARGEITRDEYLRMRQDLEQRHT